MITPSIISQQATDEAQPRSQGLPNPVSTPGKEASPTITHEVQKHVWLTANNDGALCLNESPIERLCFSTHTQILCIAGGQHMTLDRNELLLAAYGSEPIEPHWIQQWLSAYIRARAALSEMITLFAVTSTCTVLRGLTGSEGFVEALDQARDALSHVPVQIEQDAAALFAACLCIGQTIKVLSDTFERAELASSLSRIRDGHLFLVAVRQTQDALADLPLFHTVRRIWRLSQTPANAMPEGQNTPPSFRRTVIDKREEAALLRNEIVEQVKNQLQLYIALIIGAVSFLGVAIQPSVSVFTACLLPLATLSIALKIAAHDLRPGQINFYLRRVLYSPWEIVRRILFDGSQPSEEELAILAEQDIVLTPTVLKEATRLTPVVPELHSKANRLAILLFDGATIGVLLVRGIDGAARKDLLTVVEAIIALFISISMTIPGFLVLRRKRVR